MQVPGFAGCCPPLSGARRDLSTKRTGPTGGDGETVDGALIKVDGCCPDACRPRDPPRNRACRRAIYHTVTRLICNVTLRRGGNAACSKRTGAMGEFQQVSWKSFMVQLQAEMRGRARPRGWIIMVSGTEIRMFHFVSVLGACRGEVSFKYLFDNILYDIRPGGRAGGRLEVETCGTLPAGGIDGLGCYLTGGMGQAAGTGGRSVRRVADLRRPALVRSKGLKPSFSAGESSRRR